MVSSLFRIKANGNVGIGTTGPLSKLVVDDSVNVGAYKTTYSLGGGILAMNETSANTYPYISWSKGGTRGMYLGAGVPGSYLSMALENGNSLAITGGNVGIGTTSPYAKLSVAGTIVGQNFISTSTASSTFAGAIGIGTTTPKSKLDVKGGDVYIEDATSGIILRDTVTGTCARVQLTSGVLVPSAVTCP